MEDGDQNKDEDQYHGEIQSLNEDTQVENFSVESQNLPKEWRSSKNYKIHNIIGDISRRVTT